MAFLMWYHRYTAHDGSERLERYKEHEQMYDSVMTPFMYDIEYTTRGGVHYAVALANIPTETPVYFVVSIWEGVVRYEATVTTTIHESAIRESAVALAKLKGSNHDAYPSSYHDEFDIDRYDITPGTKFSTHPDYCAIDTLLQSDRCIYCGEVVESS